MKKTSSTISTSKAIQQFQHSPELLMPAGNLEKLQTAYRYGADACYIGAPNFSLRYRENQIKESDIGKAIQYAHKLNKKIYVTINIFAHNENIKKIISHLKYLRKVKPDAIIFSDPGVFNLVKKYYPEAHLHLSVQSTATNFETVKFWRDQGVERIILARELSLKEIAEIHKQVPDIELETFVHGAMCMSYSGRCLLSNYLTGRDANRGDCAHACRWNYTVKKRSIRHPELDSGSKQNGIPDQVRNDNDYVLEEQLRPGEYFPVFENEHGMHILSSQDMCLIEHLKKIKDAGVISFKVEGRAKNVSYVATIAKAYRQAIDDIMLGRKFDKKLLDEVKSVSNRGFCTGFYFGHPTLKNHQTDGNRTEGTHEFIGIVRNFDKKNNLAEVEIKGRIALGDKIEIVTPTDIKKETITEIFELSRKPVDHYNPGLENNALIKLKSFIQVSDIIRKKIIDK